MNFKEDERLQAAEMKVMRRTAGCSLLKHRRNEDNLEELKIDPIVQYINQYRLQWKGHLERVNHAKWPKQILSYVPRRRRNLGRHKKC